MGAHAKTGTDVRFIPEFYLPTYAKDDFAVFLDTLRKKHGISMFDAVILDHDEKLFLPHLKAILAKGFLRKGGTVYVDNVKRKAKQLHKYIEFVKTGSGNGFETDVRQISNPYPDAAAIS